MLLPILLYVLSYSCLWLTNSIHFFLYYYQTSINICFCQSWQDCLRCWNYLLLCIRTWNISEKNWQKQKKLTLLLKSKPSQQIYAISNFQQSLCHPFQNIPENSVFPKEKFMYSIFDGIPDGFSLSIGDNEKYPYV